MPTPIRVHLSPELLKLAQDEARRRQSVNEARRYRGRNRAPEYGEKALKMHELGTMGEVAVASFMGYKDQLFKDKTPKRGSCDLPGNVEVKTRSKHKYDLIIQKDEDPGKNLVLVTIEQGKVFIHGWCVAGDLMKQEFWDDPAGGRPAYFVPKHQLRDIQELLLKAE
jgi:hypothetical protein